MGKINLLIIIAILCGFLGYYQYSGKRYKKLLIDFRKERRKNRELNEKYVILQKKLECEIMKAQQRDVESQKAEESSKGAPDVDKANKEAERNKKLQLISEKENKLNELKAQRSNLKSAEGVELVDTAKIESNIKNTQHKIRECSELLKKANALSGNKKYTCFDSCIRDTDIKFVRKMTRTCKDTVSGGIYFCDHYDMFGSDHCSRHMRSHKGWKFPNRYRDDHNAEVRYYCRTHNIIWNQSSANSFRTYHQNSKTLLGNRLKYSRNLASLQKALYNLEAEYKAAVEKNEKNKKNHTAQAEKQKQELFNQIQTIEMEIKELRKTL